MLFHEIPSFIQEVAGQTYDPLLVPRDLYLQLRIDATDEDDLLLDLIGAATEMLESDSRRAFVSRQFSLVMDQFPYWGQLDRQSFERTSQAVGVFYGGGILIRRCPVISIDQLQYMDTTGTLQTLPSDGSDVTSPTNQYVTDIISEPARIYPAYGVPWPITRWQRNAVRITFTAGYTTAPIPKRARNAVKMLAAHWYRHPEAVGAIPQELELGYWSTVRSLRWSAGVI